MQESVAWRPAAKKLFLKISQNSQENNCSRVCKLELQAEICNFIKKETLGIGASLWILQKSQNQPF